MRRDQVKNWISEMWKIVGPLLPFILAGFLAKKGKRLGGSSICTCPQCGYTTAHVRGIPCSSIGCPNCGTSLKGEIC
jgi:hypothetical protein